ncbi:hypothetical protein [Sphingomonas sp.]|uniref:hypothetical protein n=1 Tax=Sphingomonas sp. TaxID=28214 RepID=UPI0028AD21F3|nr:hypothetical protein [Sphingomonas sp.]
MTLGDIRSYLRETIEFFIYFVFMTVLGASMFIVVNYAPQANSRWYISTCIAMSVFSGLYAVRMLRRYWRARRSLFGFWGRRNKHAGALTAPDGATLLWSERIGAGRPEARSADSERARLVEKLEAMERAYRSRCALLGIEPEEHPEDVTINPDMSLDAIRERIAERMHREDERAEEEKQRMFR